MDDPRQEHSPGKDDHHELFKDVSSGLGKLGAQEARRAAQAILSEDGGTTSPKSEASPECENFGSDDQSPP